MKLKDQILALVPLAVLFFGAVDSRATEYYDYDNINIWLSEANPLRTGTFNIADQGYSSANETIISADVEFVVWDSDANADGINIRIGGHDFASGSVSQGFTMFGGSLIGEALLNLTADGRVGYRIQWLSGDAFKVSAVSLIAQTTPNSTIPGVPDGGTTLALLGLGLVGLEWGRRKIKS